MYYTLVWGSFYQIWWPQGIFKEFDLWLTLLTPAWLLTPAMSYTLIRDSCFQFGGQLVIRHFWAIWPLVNSCWPVHDLWPSNELFSGQHGQGFFPPNLVAIGHCLAYWPLLDPSWSLHDLRPQQCITLSSGVFPTKFGGHMALLSKLTPSWTSWLQHDLWP